jgi:hypothetical protein
MTAQPNPRLAILRGKVERDMLDPLREHGWQCEIAAEVEAGEYVLVRAERAGTAKSCAVLYSSGTGYDVYRRLAEQVDTTFIHGEPYRLNEFAREFADSVLQLDSFHAVLLDWNRETSRGRIAADTAESDGPVEEERAPARQLLSETPIDAIWLRLRQFQSVRLAEKLVSDRAARDGISLDAEAVEHKALGVAFALRNAVDYFQASPSRTVSQRILNLYYGSMAFAFAEMLARPDGPETLAGIEDRTRQGHGLYALDGDTGDFGDILVGTIRSGFFSYWQTTIGIAIDNIPSAKPKTPADAMKLTGETVLSLEALFARIPELSDLFLDIFPGPAWWLEPDYDQRANGGMHMVRIRPVVTRTYATLTDWSGRLRVDDVATFPGPLSELQRLPAEGDGRRFRAAVDHPPGELWWRALSLHYSPLGPTGLIKPIFGSVGDYRAICFVLLYALSILVRYRPSIWRRIQEGDLDHVRVLIEAFLAVVERVLPEQFLAIVTGERISAKQPGSWR